MFKDGEEDEDKINAEAMGEKLDESDGLPAQNVDATSSSVTDNNPHPVSIALIYKNFSYFLVSNA